MQIDKTQANYESINLTTYMQHLETMLEIKKTQCFPETHKAMNTSGHACRCLPTAIY